MSEPKLCPQCGQEKPIEDFSKSYKNLCKTCVAENEKMKRATNKLLDLYRPTILPESSNAQFIPHPRFTASVAILQGLLASGKDQTNSVAFLADRAVEYADALLIRLNKNYDPDND